MATKKPSSGEGEYIARDEAKRRSLDAIRRRQDDAGTVRAFVHLFQGKSG